MGNSDEAQGPANDSRAKEIYDRWAIWGETQQQIAKKYGVSHQRVSQIIKEWRAANPAVREDLAAQSIAMLNELRDRQFRLAEQTVRYEIVGVDNDALS
jgi:DNA-binding transcriptional regulator LsrR (DeoR family)